MNPISLIATGQVDPSPTESGALPGAGLDFANLLFELIPAPQTAADVQPTPDLTECATKPGLPLQEPDLKPPLEIIPEEPLLHPEAALQSFSETEAKNVLPTPAKTKGPRIPELNPPEKPGLHQNPFLLIAPASFVPPQTAPPVPTTGTEAPLTISGNAFAMANRGLTIANSRVPATAIPHTLVHSFDPNDSPVTTAKPLAAPVTTSMEKEYVPEPAAISFPVGKNVPIPIFTLNQRSIPHTSVPAVHNTAIPIPSIGVQSIRIEGESVAFTSLPAPQQAAPAPAAPVKAETEITLNLPRPMVASNPIDFKEQTTTEQQTGNLILPGLHHEVKSIAPGGPSLSFGGQQNLSEHLERPVKPSPKPSADTMPVTSEDPAEAMHTEIPATAPLEAVRPVEIPALPTVQVARRVSIDVGDDDSRVRITIHERAGDVSVKFDTATEGLRSHLQSSVGSLIEAFRREHVPLANLDFTNVLGNAADSNRQREQRQHAKMVRPQAALEEFAISEIEVNGSGKSINIHA